MEATQKLVLWNPAENLTERMSQAYTDLLNKSQSDQTFKTARTQVLDTLRKYSTCKKNHFDQETNWDRYAVTVCDVLYKESPFYIPELPKLAHTFLKDHVVPAVDWFERFESINEEKRAYFVLIRECDLRKGRSDEQFERNNVHPSDLKEFQDHFSSNTCPVCENNSWDEDKASRNKLISLAYSLVNLQDSNANKLVLLDVLSRLSTYKKFHDFEMAFVQFSWMKYKNAGSPAQIPTVLLENFTFLYEVPFINYCTKMLLGDGTAVAISKDLNVIAGLCRTNKGLQCSITGMLYELYACSGYSDRLWEVFSLFGDD